MAFGVTDQGFVLKRLYDIIQDMDADLAQVSDPNTGATLNLTDENDPLVQLKNATADALSVCWEQLQLCYNQFDPLKATGAGLSGLVQLNGLSRKTGETDIELRKRQQVCTEETATSLIEALYGKVMAVAGVTFCRIYQNATLTTDARGITGKTIAPVIVGGNDFVLAKTLVNAISTGLEMQGSTTVTLYDSYFQEYHVKFTRPTEVPVYIAIELDVVSSYLWPENGVALIKQSIVDFALKGASSLGIPTGFDQAGYPPGTSVNVSELYIPINSVPGAKVNTVFVGLTADPTSGTSVAIDWDEHASILLENITITII